MTHIGFIVKERLSAFVIRIAAKPCHILKVCNLCFGPKYTCLSIIPIKFNSMATVHHAKPWPFCFYISFTSNDRGLITGEHCSSPSLANMSIISLRTWYVIIKKLYGLQNSHSSFLKNQMSPPIFTYLPPSLPHSSLLKVPSTVDCNLFRLEEWTIWTLVHSLILNALFLVYQFLLNRFQVKDHSASFTQSTSDTKYVLGTDNSKISMFHDF